MRFPRSSGTLVHPTSFPSPHGIGDLGSESRNFIDFLYETGQTIWQVLPLGPTGYGNSPYASYSAFAGNHYLISLDILVKKGLLTKSESDNAILPVTIHANYEAAYSKKESLFKLASERFYESVDKMTLKTLEKFCTENSFWLEDYCLFMACSKANGRQPWNQWEDGIALRRKDALKNAEKEFEAVIKHEKWLQFEFFNQWNELKEYANSKQVRVIGDIPIYVDHNSADVWSNPASFAVDKKGNRTLVAGVPPDYFSETGQLWGNPQYKWKVLEKDGFKWWIERFRQMFHLYDAIRVDHFRGFDAYWEVPASEKTAINGKWVKGPGAKLFDAIKKELGELPIIAEDLGFVTKGVEELRDAFEFPGMKILQFAWDSDSANSFLPHNFTQNSVVYTGTHDNDTTLGWYNSAPETEKHRLREYCRSNGTEPNWELIRLGMLSVSDQAIFPLQDFMNLNEKHRMNTPGTVGANWLWRYTPDMLTSVDGKRIKELIEISNRKPQ
jgi:4-alpha-glucanotransferase